MRRAIGSEKAETQKRGNAESRNKGIANCRFPSANYELQVTYYKLQITKDEMLRVRSDRRL